MPETLRSCPSSSHRWLAVGVAALLAASAYAADPAPAKGKPPAKAATPAAASPKQPVMTREELRACLAEQDRIAKEGAELAQAQARIDKDRADIERTGGELEAEKAKLDLGDEAAVNAYNERLRQRKQRFEDLKAFVPGFNTRVEKLAVDRQAYATACAERRFFEDDLEAIKAGK